MASRSLSQASCSCVAPGWAAAIGWRTGIATAAAGLGAACFLGDDRGDLAAFDALDRLAGDSVHVTRIAVRSSEMPEELERRADIVVDGPEGALELLRALLP